VHGLNRIRPYMRELLPRTAWSAALLSSFIVVGLTGQQGNVTLRGSVRDSATSAPVAGAAVLFDGATLPLTTDSSGCFTVGGIDRGVRILLLMKTGYSPRTVPIADSRGETDTLDIGTVLMSPGAAPTGRIVGTVIDSMTTYPVAWAEVVVNGETMALTNLGGFFEIPSAQLVWGSNLLRVRRMGYAPLDAEIWTAAQEPSFSFEIILIPLALPMAEIVVEGERTIYHFGQVRGFVRRSRTGLGRYITRQDIEKKQPLVITDLIARVPGIYVTPIGTGSQIRIMRGGGCMPELFIDRVRLTALAYDFDINDMVTPGDVEGVEIYKGAATTPFEFNMTGRACGAVVIWTRRR